MTAQPKAQETAQKPTAVIHLVPNGHKEKLETDLHDFKKITASLTKAKNSKVERQDRMSLRLEMLRKAIPLIEQYNGLIYDLQASVKDVLTRLKEEGGYDSKTLKLVMARRADEGAAAQLTALLDNSAHIKKLLELDFETALQLEMDLTL